MDPIESASMLKLKSFVGDVKIKKMEEFFSSTECGVFVVAGWFVSVVEGVDMWFPTLSMNSRPRFRMKVKVNDGEEAAVFSLFDSDVESLAVETCSLLRSMGESCSTFPDEMECYYGDAILYKVEKHHFEEDEKNADFNVISICNDVDVVNKFIDEYLPHISNNSHMQFFAKSHIPHLGLAETVLEAKSAGVASGYGLFDYMGCESFHFDGHVKKRNSLTLPLH
ncbi:replication protein A 70 kDa DNA-binding subunit C [Trifolium repens]|nr:replication protein A 70 kDa DNA-binding subunit C [Trifolium repens]